MLNKLHFKLHEMKAKRSKSEGEQIQRCVECAVLGNLAVKTLRCAVACLPTGDTSWQHSDRSG